MTDRRPMIDMPKRCEHLPIDKRGYPVPKFVETVNGEPDFRVMKAKHLVDCVKRRLCWICGEPLGQFYAFPIGPMCAVNRITSEPPNHLGCAMFAIKNCPFLSNPAAKRREHGMPEDKVAPGGIMLAHNPGGVCLWITKQYRVVQVTRPGAGGILFNLGEPSEVTWWVRGQPATRDEVKALLAKGLPKLVEQCERDDDPAEAFAALTQAVHRVEQYLPKGETANVG